MKSLFIAGNGFDTQHCVQFKTESGKLIKNSYRDFAKFFEEENKEIFDLFDEQLFRTNIENSEKYQGWDNLERENLNKALESESDLDNPNDPINIFYKNFKKWIENLNSNMSIDNFIDNKDKKEEFEGLKEIISDKEMYFINLITQIH